MKIRIFPSRVQGTLTAPSSKSDIHRGLICAALAMGESHIRVNDPAIDALVTADALGALGAEVIRTDDGFVVRGTDPFSHGGAAVDCGESGSTLRFLIPVLALAGEEMLLTGSGRLLSRPLAVYEEFFKQSGGRFEHDDRQVRVQGPVKPGEYELDGNSSSQFFSGLAFALPLLPEDSLIHIREPFESRSYVEMTINSLNSFGVRVELKDNDLIIPGRQHYHPSDYQVEADYSGAAFLALAGLGGKMTIAGLNPESTHGDRIFMDILRQIGAVVTVDANRFTIQAGTYRPITVSLADCPDLGPVTMALGAYGGVGMTIKDIYRLRYKESDRIAAMSTELAKLGYRMEVRENEAVILAGKPELCGEVNLSGHHDHRIVMALAVLAALGKRTAVIEDAQAVSKSYPNFFTDLQAAGIRWEAVE